MPYPAIKASNKLEIWGEKINEFFRAKLVAAPFFTDRSDEVSEGGDVLYTPSVTELSANAKSNATAVLSSGIGLCTC
jgi:hypothetical protein